MKNLTICIVESLSGWMASAGTGFEQRQTVYITNHGGLEICPRKSCSETPKTDYNQSSSTSLLHESIHVKQRPFLFFQETSMSLPER